MINLKNIILKGMRLWRRRNNPDILLRSLRAAENDEQKEYFRYIFRYFPVKLAYIYDRYELNRKQVLDIGSGWGHLLVHFSTSSVGLNNQEEQIEFCSRMDLNVCHRDVEKDSLQDLGTFDVILCSHIIEHLVSPAGFLKKLKRLLNPGGVIILIVPSMASSGFGQSASKLILGSPAGYSEGHLYGFTAQSMELMIRAAGYRTVEAGTFLSRFSLLNKLFTAITTLFGGQHFHIIRPVAADEPY